MATFWERAAHSVDHMFSLYSSWLIVMLVICHFGFEGGTLVLIASVPGHCLSFTFCHPKTLFLMPYICVPRLIRVFILFLSHIGSLRRLKTTFSLHIKRTPD